LIKPGFVVPNGADTGKQIDIAHYLGIDNRRDLVQGNLFLIAIKANLIGSEKEIDTGLLLFT